MLQKKTIIFTDGASKGNPGPGGWGAVVLEEEKVSELGGRKEITTNNEMELVALIKSLQRVRKKEREVQVYIDSKYVLNGATIWRHKWKKQGWVTAGKLPVTHEALWQELDALLEKFNVAFEYIPGHAGVPGNERVDDIAQAFAVNKTPELFVGKAAEYSVDLRDTKRKHAGASDKKKRSRGTAYSYVSVVDGKVLTHKSWVECEKRVKGTKGARFKKALTVQEEQALQREYGRLE